MKTNHTNNTPKGMPPAQPDPGSYSWKLLLIKDARVHYVVLKQQPRTTHPTHTTRKGAETCMIGAARKPETQVPHPTPPGRHPAGTPPKNMSHGPVASGPNSVPNTTRRYRSGSVPGPPPFSEEK